MTKEDMLLALDSAIGELQAYAASQSRVGSGTSTDFALEWLKQVRDEIDLRFDSIASNVDINARAKRNAEKRSA